MKMKSSILIKLAVILAVSLVLADGSLLFAQDADTVAKKAASNPDKAGARIELENNIADFGVVGPKSKHTFEYKFKNVGDEKLVISHVQSTCGCSVPQLSKKEYEPGENGVVTVAYTASAHEGAVTKKLYIHSNDKINPRFALSIKSNTVLKVEALPKKFELSLVKPNAGLGVITLKSKDGQLFAIKGIDSPGQAITADFNKGEKAASFTLKPKADLKKLENNLNGGIKIMVDHPECSQVMVKYTTLPQFNVSPARVLFLNAEPGAKQSREIWIKSNYTDSIEIASVKSDKGYIKVVSQEIKGAMAKLNIELTAPEPNGKARYFNDALKVKIKDSETLEIKCSGWFKKSVLSKKGS